MPQIVNVEQMTAEEVVANIERAIEIADERASDDSVLWSQIFRASFDGLSQRHTVIIPDNPIMVPGIGTNGRS